METIIQETERKVNALQKIADNCRDEKQKAFFTKSLQNAKQVLANYREMDRILKGGQANDTSPQ